MSLVDIVKRVLGVYDYDRVGEKRILKAIELYHKGGKFNHFRAKRLYNKNMSRYGVSIHPNIEVGKNFHLVHADSIRIGMGVSIGDNCKIYPYCHIMGSLKKETRVDLKVAGGATSTIYKKAKIGNDCILGAGCAIIGAITIGDDVTIGARAIVSKDIPAHSVVKGTNLIRPKREDEIPEKYKA